MNFKVQKVILISVVALIGLVMVVPVSSHCEIPCGIYGDQMRIKMMSEHIDTIEKSIKQVIELGKEKDVNYNQLVRWVTNKDDHADKFSEIITQYFLKQRLSPVEASGDGYEKYIAQLTTLHAMMVNSMKCKQTTDLKYIESLRKNLADFEKMYFNKDDHGHSH